jgi:hypothetical protein
MFGDNWLGAGVGFVVFPFVFLVGAGLTLGGNWLGAGVGFVVFSFVFLVGA